MFGARPGQLVAELAEAAAAAQQRVDEQQAPAVADAIEGGLERAGRRAAAAYGVVASLMGSMVARWACAVSMCVVCCKSQLTTH